MPTLRKPRAIRPGATIGIAAPAGPIDPELLDEGCGMLRELGFEPRHRPDIVEREGYLAGSDERRAAEFMELVEDPDVDAIVCARGGYGCHRIVSRLDAAAVRRAAKPLVGYSDVTTLLLWQRRVAGLVGLHGPMFEHGRIAEAEARESLVRALTGTGALPRFQGKTAASGWGEGRLVGGNLAVLLASLGTPWEIDTRGAILCFEDVNELPFRIDRALQQLLAAGKLDAVEGVAVGSLVGCESERNPAPSAEDVIAEALAPLEIPVVLGLPFGHGQPNLTWPFGGRAALDGDRGELELLEAGVATR